MIGHYYHRRCLVNVAIHSFSFFFFFFFLAAKATFGTVQDVESAYESNNNNIQIQIKLTLLLVSFSSLLINTEMRHLVDWISIVLQFWFNLIFVVDNFIARISSMKLHFSCWCTRVLDFIKRWHCVHVSLQWL